MDMSGKAYQLEHTFQKYFFFPRICEVDISQIIAYTIARLRDILW